MFTGLLLVVFYLIPPMSTSTESPEEPPSCKEDDMKGEPCPENVRSLLYTTISKKLWYIDPKYDCELEDGALGRLILDDWAWPRFFGDLKYAEELRRPRVDDEEIICIWIHHNMDFLAIQKKLEVALPLKMRATMLNTFGCNYLEENGEEDENYNKYSVCCLFR